MKGGVEYPTEKPHALLARIIQACTNPGDLVLDCFVGSGKTATAAQELGRRWIGCDINKGAIQTTSKRLQKIMGAQVADAAKPSQNGFDDAEDEPPSPAQTGFADYRVNDYDLAIQHNEAVNLACEHIGVERKKTDPFFDGTLGGGRTQELVKIVPFDHPLGVEDLEAVRRELESRGGEETRGVVLVSVGKELAVDAWLEEWNKHRGISRLDEQNRPIEFVNKVRSIELLTDKQYGSFFVHQPAQADVSISRENGKVRVEIRDFVSPTIITRLGMDAADVPLFRAFSVALSDVPEKKNDLVAGSYELPAPEGPATVAVKIVDMLGEEVLTTQRLES